MKMIDLNLGSYIPEDVEMRVGDFIRMNGDYLRVTEVNEKGVWVCPGGQTQFFVSRNKRAITEGLEPTCTR